MFTVFGDDVKKGAVEYGTREKKRNWRNKWFKEKKNRTEFEKEVKMFFFWISLRHETLESWLWTRETFRFVQGMTYNVGRDDKTQLWHEEDKRKFEEQKKRDETRKSSLTWTLTLKEVHPTNVGGLALQRWAEGSCHRQEESVKAGATCSVDKVCTITL